MTNSSSSSPRKARRGLFYGAAGAVLVILAVNFAGTLLAVRMLGILRGQMAAATPYSLGVRGVSFNVFRGLALTGVTIHRGSQPFFDADRIDVGFEGVSYVRRPLRIKNVRITTLKLVTARFTELVEVGRHLSRWQMPLAFYDTFQFVCRDVAFDNTVTLNVSGYLNAVNSELYTLRGRLVLLKVRCAAFPEFDVFEGSGFTRPFDYEFQASRVEDRLEIAPIELSNARLKVFGAATVEGIAGPAPVIDLKLELPNILLEDMPALNRGNVRACGVLELVGVMRAELLRPQTALTVNFKNGALTLFDSLYFSGMNGKTVFSDNRFSGEGLRLDLNGVPFAADLTLSAAAQPHLDLSLASLSQVAGAPQVIWHMQADWKGDHLRGAAGGSVRYAGGRDTIQQLSFDLRDLRLGYDEDLYLYARTLDVGMKILAAGGAAATPQGSFQRAAQLEYLFGVLRKQPDGFGLKHVKANCYGGNLEGEASFTPSREEFFARGELHVRDVNLRKYAETSSPASTLTRGQLDGDLRFDNSQADRVKGQAFVKNGEIERNPILNAVADFLGIRSLKCLPFGDLSIFFNGGRGDYAVEVRLASSLVDAEIDGKVQSYETMDGYLSASLSSQLLHESRSFNKLLTYLKHDEPYVIFPFKISSYISSPRILWLKNEFKEKIQKILPERNKRYLQTQISTIIEKAGAQD